MPDLTGLLADAAPFLIGLVVFLVGWRVLRHVLGRRPDAGRLRAQLVLSGFGFVGGLTVLLLLPLGQTTRGQILSFLGILLSAAIALSATTFLGNALGGLMLRAVRNFRIGDFIRVGEQLGRVSERGLFHVEVQTEDGDLTTIPNLFLVTHPVTTIPSQGALVSAKVSLGYDVPRAQIEACLLAAAQTAQLTDAFVHVLELGDFSVLYRVSGVLADAHSFVSARSRLRGAMLDALHGAGIEIVSPNFMNTRAFPVEKQFVPPATSAPPAADAGATADDVIFAKAVEAEALDAEIAQLRARLAEVEGTDAAEAVKAELAAVEAQVEEMRGAQSAAPEGGSG